MTNEFATLRSANIARNALWFHGVDMDAAAMCLWRATELAGEVGELLEAVRDWRAVIQEGADVAICLDLTMMNMGMPPLDLTRPSYQTPRWDTFQRWCRSSVNDTAREMAMAALLYCNLAKKWAREELDMPGGRTNKAEMQATLEYMGVLLLAVYYLLATDAEQYVRAVFNRKSTQVGINVYIGEPEAHRVAYEQSLENYRLEARRSLEKAAQGGEPSDALDGMAGQ